MPIQFQCPSCQASFTVPDDAAGKSGKCRKCGAKITVPNREDNLLLLGEDEGTTGGSTLSCGANSSVAVVQPKVDALPTQTGPNEMIFPGSFQMAISKVAKAMTKLGSVTKQNESQQYVEGRIKYGLQSVKVRVSVAPAGNDQCRIVIQGSSDDVWGTGAKNATRRLMDMLRNIDNPGYQADRRGIGTGPLIAVVVGFGILIVLILHALGLV